MPNNTTSTPEQTTRRRRARRVGVFVDMANIEMHAKDNGAGGRPHFPALLGLANKRGRPTVRALYTSYRPGIDERRLAGLRQQGWQIVRAPLREGQNGALKSGNMDAALAFDLGFHARHLDEVILVTGDGDFVPVITLLQKHGKRVLVIAPDGPACHAGLVIEADECLRASQVPEFLPKAPTGSSATRIADGVAESSSRDPDANGALKAA